MLFKSQRTSFRWHRLWLAPPTPAVDSGIGRRVETSRKLSADEEVENPASMTLHAGKVMRKRYLDVDRPGELTIPGPLLEAIAGGT
mmetsp:Transcript_9447/g.13815  ORF Transcript_9447/g.13815 Transcript_9447/m.13815 type:complete len:86 (+) Transcript_9447:242-499(+)